MSAKFSPRLVKDHSRTILGRLGLYERARASWIYDFYWSIANPRIIQDRTKEVDFYRNLLGGFRRGDLIFDVGANQGYKTGIFLRLGARVIAVEPDEVSQEVLRQRFVHHRLRSKPVTIVGKAVSDGSTVERMWIDAPGSAKNTLSRKWVEALMGDGERFSERPSFGQSRDVGAVSMEQLINSYGAPFFVKIDVEGHELRVLRGLRQPVPYLSFEVNLPEFRPEGLECVRVLGQLAHHGRFNYTPDCRQGLVLKRWVPAPEFVNVLDQCAEPSIEVFWETTAAFASVGTGPAGCV